jgi:hypothetical protein
VVPAPFVPPEVRMTVVAGRSPGEVTVTVIGPDARPDRTIASALPSHASREDAL